MWGDQSKPFYRYADGGSIFRKSDDYTFPSWNAYVAAGGTYSNYEIVPRPAGAKSLAWEPPVITTTTNVAASSVSPWLLYGGLALAAWFLLKK